MLRSASIPLTFFFTTNAAIVTANTRLQNTAKAALGNNPLGTLSVGLNTVVIKLS